MRRAARMLAVGGVTASLLSLGGLGGRPATAGPPPPRVVAQSGPLPSPTPPAPARRWIDIAEPRGVTLRAAIVSPEGTQPVPIVIVLHGTEGFHEEHVHLAEAFAREGFLAIAGCWFAGEECPHGPFFSGATLEATRHVRALVAAAVALPRARAGSVALFGHSRGGMLALLAGSTEGEVHAIVASSAQYEPSLTASRRPLPLDVAPRTAASGLHAPVLILHTTADFVSDVRDARAYERTLRDLGKPVEAHYYEPPGHLYDAASHRLALSPETQGDVVRRSVDFLWRHLGR
jgi:dienelactone hydrolase